jgi:transcriptional regulator with XRE-family HTH domain
MGARIKRARIKAKLTQYKAATLLGFQAQLWWAYENGRIVPGGPRTVAIARALGVSSDWLVSGKGKP